MNLACTWRFWRVYIFILQPNCGFNDLANSIVHRNFAICIVQSLAENPSVELISSN